MRPARTPRLKPRSLIPRKLGGGCKQIWKSLPSRVYRYQGEVNVIALGGICVDENCRNMSRRRYHLKSPMFNAGTKKYNNCSYMKNLFCFTYPLVFFIFIDLFILLIFIHVFLHSLQADLLSFRILASVDRHTNSDVPHQHINGPDIT